MWGNRGNSGNGVSSFDLAWDLGPHLSLQRVTVTVGNWHFLSSLLPPLSHFFFFSILFPSISLVYPSPPRGPFGCCPASLADLWTKKVVHVENNLTWGFYKRESGDKNSGTSAYSSAPPTQVWPFIPGRYFAVMHRAVLGTVFFCHLAYHMTLLYKSNQVWLQLPRGEILKFPH